MRDAAVSIEILESDSTEHVPPPVMLDGMLERITAGVPGHATAADGVAALTTLDFHHAPVERYTLNDCVVHEGGVEYLGGNWPKTNVWKDRIPLGPIEEIASGSYCMRPVSHQYFGHWLRDACSTALLADKTDALFLDERSDWPDVTHYARAFGLATTRAQAAYVSTLRLYSDHSQGQLKRQRYAVLRERMQRFLGAPKGQSRPVYLRRGSTGVSRQIENEPDLCEKLCSEGFEIVDLSSLDFPTRYEKLSGAPVVVTVEGSHLNHAYFAMMPNTSLLVLIPGNRFSAVHRGVSRAMGMRFGCVVLQFSGTAAIVNPDEVLRTLDMLSSAE